MIGISEAEVFSDFIFLYFQIHAIKNHLVEIHSVIAVNFHLFTKDNYIINAYKRIVLRKMGTIGLKTMKIDYGVLPHTILIKIENGDIVVKRFQKETDMKIWILRHNIKSIRILLLLSNKAVFA